MRSNTSVLTNEDPPVLTPNFNPNPQSQIGERKEKSKERR